MILTKAIILAGGHGIRLSPFTSYTNKHLLPIYHNGTGTPIIEFGIQALKNAGIRDVAIVLGDHHCEDIFSFLKDGSQYKMHFEYFWQGKPLGIAQAVTCADEFINHPDHEKFIVYLGDNFFSNGIKEFIESCNYKFGANLLFAQTKTPEKYGCPIFSDVDPCPLLKIVEKPEYTRNPLALTGCYCFDYDFYNTFMIDLLPSQRGEYELTDLINIMIKDKVKIKYQFYGYNGDKFDGFWSDMGTYESIMEVEKYLNQQ